MLYPLFRKCIIDHSLLKKGDRVVVAASGGIDSMVLLELFHRLAPNMDLSVIAAHVNHKLRGRDSLADEKLVKSTAKQYGIPFECAGLKPPKGKNLQDEARQLRYKFLSKVAAKHKAPAVAVAHHSGDQAETVLMHLLRGAGLSGLRGMQLLSVQTNLRIIRPLLGASRKDIKKYAKEKKILFREDRTNAKTDYQRNLVRHKLLPELSKFNPRIEETLAEMAGLITDEDDALNMITAASFQEMFVNLNEDQAIALRVNDYKTLPPAIRRRVLRFAFSRIAGNTKDLNRDQLARMDQIACRSSPKGHYQLPAGLKFDKDSGLIHIYR